MLKAIKLISNYHNLTFYVNLTNTSSIFQLCKVYEKIYNAIFKRIILFK